MDQVPFLCPKKYTLFSGIQLFMESSYINWKIWKIIKHLLPQPIFLAVNAFWWVCALKKHVKDNILLLLLSTHRLKLWIKVSLILTALNCWNAASNHDFDYEVPKMKRGAITEWKTYWWISSNRPWWWSNAKWKQWLVSSQPNWEISVVLHLSQLLAQYSFTK